MAKLKRKGSTFVTEHYASEETLTAIIVVLQKLIAYKRSKDEQGNFLRYLQNAEEMSIWADPRGLFFTGSRTLPKTPIPWKNLNVDPETIKTLLMGLLDIFQEYGDDCNPSYHFRVVLNEHTFQKITAIYLV